MSKQYVQEFDCRFTPQLNESAKTISHQCRTCHQESDMEHGYGAPQVVEKPTQYSTPSRKFIVNLFPNGGMAIRKKRLSSLTTLTPVAEIGYEDSSRFGQIGMPLLQRSREDLERSGRAISMLQVNTGLKTSGKMHLQEKHSCDVL